MTSQRPGVAHCRCGQRVLFALPHGEDEPVAIDPAEDGPLVAWQDDTGTARCRPWKPGEPLALGEYFFRPHDPVCPALAPVVAITTAPSLRPRPRTATGGRRASAR